MVPKKQKKWKWGIKVNKKKLSIFFWAFFCIWFVGILLYSNTKIFQKRMEMEKNLEKLDANVESLTKEKESLRFSLGETYSDEYLEKVAREDLGMQKAGEKVVVIKKDTSGSDDSGQSGNNPLSSFIDWVKSIFKSPE